MSTSTLTSLAILRVTIDQGGDYLDYIRPFVLQVLIEHDPDPVTNGVISQRVREQFGLEIPERTVEVILRRLSKRYPIKREDGVYRRTGNLPNPQLALKQAAAERHIEAVLTGLQDFSQATANPTISDEQAVLAICAFLAEFDITCLRAYLRGTAIPDLTGEHQAHIVLVSDYVQHLRRTDPERFDSFLVLVQGHMLANALTCPDLINSPRTYRNMTFYLDTPLLVRRLGSEGEAKQAAVSELIALLKKLEGRVAAFAHSRGELQRVLQGAANFLESYEGRGAIVVEARRHGITRSDILLLAESIDEEFDKAGIEVDATPLYINEFQIDETVFERVLEDSVYYYNPRAKEYDINSVRSIYVIRGDRPVLSVEKARAILVTSNGAFAKAAWEYGQQYESSQNVSSVITDFTLANVAWLKSPMGALAVPTTQLLAFSYAALEPSPELWGKYLKEIDRLEAKGTITERDHQLLRSSPLVSTELMHLTLGEDASLTEATVTETLERVSSEIKKEESERLTEEQKVHQETREALISQEARNHEIVRNLYWTCRGRARVAARLLSVGIAGLLAIGLLSGLGLRTAVPIASWVLIVSSAALILLTLLNLLVGTSVKDIHAWVQDKYLTWLLRREASALGIDLSEIMTE